jgi:Ca2+-binding RTX toxin-like protein
MAVSDVIFVQDLTGSFADDLLNQQVLLPAVVNRITNPILTPVFGTDLKLGLASFKDKPISPLGDSGDYVYRPELALTNNPTTVGNVIKGWTANGGADEPESQLDALLYTALDSGTGLDYRPRSFRVILLSTDAPFHVAGDRAGVSADTIPNNGDAVINPLEDYPAIPEVKTALEINNTIPIFLTTTEDVPGYRNLVTQLGRGGVLPLRSNSENVADAIKEAIARARNVVSDNLGTPEADFINTASFSSTTGDKIVFVGDGDDEVSLAGVTGNHFIDGGAGSDILFGGSGADTVDGGSDSDNLVGGNGNDLLFGSSGDDQLRGNNGNDSLQGDSGNDLLTGGTGADKFVFATGAKFVLSELGVDTINDFNPSEGDKIQLSKTTFDALSNTVFPSALNAANFAIVASDALAATSGAEIVYNSSNGILYYNPNREADNFGEGGQFATLTTKPSLTTTSFEVVA